MNTISHGIRPLIEGFRGVSKRPSNGQTRDALYSWFQKLDGKMSTRDDNFFHLMSHCFHDLSHLSVVVPPDISQLDNIKDVVKWHHCHTVALSIADAMIKTEGAPHASIWWGFADFHEYTKGYSGTWCHSYLTMSVDGQENVSIFDPIMIRAIMEKESFYSTNHCGFRIPYEVAVDLDKRARSLGLSNWSRYILRVVLNSRDETNKLISLIENSN